jgi:hypothetical protein
MFVYNLRINLTYFINLENSFYEIQIFMFKILLEYQLSPYYFHSVLTNFFLIC